MICQPCMVAADFKRQRAHKMCTGCACQHKLPGTGIKKDIKHAQGPTK